LVAYITCCFPPSEQLLPFVATHILGQICTSRGEPRRLRVSDVAEFALRALQKTVRLRRRSTLRTHPPSLMELEALMNGQPLMVRVLLPDGSTKGAHIDSHTLVEDLYKHVAARSHLHHVSSFGLYQHMNTSMRFLPMNSVFADALGFVDTQLAHSKSKGRATKLHFELRRRFLFNAQQSQFTDPVERHVMVCQLAEDLRVCRLLAPADSCVELAALKVCTRNLLAIAFVVFCAVCFGVRVAGVPYALQWTCG
jgi:RA like domain/MyTH4 domain